MAVISFKLRALRRGQGAPVNLATRSQRHPLQHDEGCWRHVVRQPLSQIAPQLFLRDSLADHRRHVSDESFAALRLFTGYDQTLTHRRVSRQHTLHLFKLNAEAPDLYLMIAAPQELDQPICPVARQVARAVQPPARLKGVGVGYELLGSQPSRVEVAARQA